MIPFLMKPGFTLNQMPEVQEIVNSVERKTGFPD